MPDFVVSANALLERTVALNASDLHLTAGSQPVVRMRGRLERLEDLPELTADQTRDILYTILST
jgi:twitching motility protein PilT